MVSCPIRHHKTGTIIAAIAWWLKRDPTLRIIYMTYSIKRAEEIGKDIRDTCKRMGVLPEKGYDTISNWRTEHGGGVACMSADQSKLGADVDILIWDDPYESGSEADKPEVRNTVDETIAHYTMRLSRGGSCIGVMSRWHPDDAVGRRLARVSEQWVYIHKKAISDDGVALAPDIRTIEEMAAIRAALAEIDPTERMWWSQWQNEPRTPQGGGFKEPMRYIDLPTWPGFRTIYGLDMAYSQSKVADFAAIVALRAWGSKAYVINAMRFKLEIGGIATELQSMRALYGPGQIYSYVSGPEVGIVRNMASRGIHIHGMPARYNKLVRAEKTKVRWNDGGIMVPNISPWGGQFVQRVQAFRGVEGDDDDEVDALVSACDGGLFGATQVPTTLGSWRF